MSAAPNRQGLADYLRSHPHPGGIIACPARRFIYMKPAKTAGTSILRATLEKHVPGIIHHKDHPGEFRDWLQRINDDDLADYYIFCVVRNPWERAVSVAAYLDIPFARFIRHFDDCCRDDRTREHALPLSLYTHLNGQPFVDDICRFETLQEDFNRVAARIGLEQNLLPHTNPSRHTHYSSYYQDGDVEQVAQIYRDDIDNFGYRFQRETPLPAQAPAPARRGLRALLKRTFAFMPGFVVRLLGQRKFAYRLGDLVCADTALANNAALSPNFRELLGQLRYVESSDTAWQATRCAASGRMVVSSRGGILLDLFPVTVNGENQRYAARWDAYLRSLAGGRARTTEVVATGGLVSIPFFNNYYHFLVDVLLRYARAVADGALPKGLVFVSTSPLRSFQAQLLEVLGIDVAVHTTVRVERLLVPPSQRQGFCYSRPALQALRQVYVEKLELPGDSPPRRIYISRRGASNRRIANEEELAGFLRARGYEIIVPETLGAAEQIGLFCNADVVIGPHGAGLANILFRESPVLVELLPEDDARWGHYAALCASLDGRYHNVIGTPVNASNDFTVNLQQVSRALDLAEQSGRAGN